MYVYYIILQLNSNVTHFKLQSRQQMSSNHTYFMLLLYITQYHSITFILVITCLHAGGLCIISLYSLTINAFIVQVQWCNTCITCTLREVHSFRGLGYCRFRLLHVLCVFCILCYGLWFLVTFGMLWGSCNTMGALMLVTLCDAL